MSSSTPKSADATIASLTSNIASDNNDKTKITTKSKVITKPKTFAKGKLYKFSSSVPKDLRIVAWSGFAILLLSKSFFILACAWVKAMFTFIPATLMLFMVFFILLDDDEMREFPKNMDEWFDKVPEGLKAWEKNMLEWVDNWEYELGDSWRKPWIKAKQNTRASATQHQKGLSHLEDLAMMAPREEKQTEIAELAAEERNPVVVKQPEEKAQEEKETEKGEELKQEKEDDEKGEELKQEKEYDEKGQECMEEENQKSVDESESEVQSEWELVPEVE
ncbi:MAG: hypothetical protein Q9218_006959 [Villophora microphyllina]